MIGDVECSMHAQESVQISKNVDMIPPIDTPYITRPFPHFQPSIYLSFFLLLLGEENVSLTAWAWSNGIGVHSINWEGALDSWDRLSLLQYTFKP